MKTTTASSISTERFLELTRQMNYVESWNFTTDFPGMPPGRVLFQLNAEPKLLLAVAGGTLFWMQDQDSQPGSTASRLIGMDLADWSEAEMRWAGLSHEGASLLRQAGRERSRTKYKAAAEKFEALLQEFPADCTARLFLGHVLAHCGREEKALKTIRGALKMANGDLGILLSAASIFDSLFWLAEAAEVYQAILVREPNHPLALARLPVMLMAQGKTGELEPIIRRAIQLLPAETDLHGVYADFGMHLVKLGRVAEAKRALQELDKATCDNGVVEMLRATLLEADGKAEEARKTQARAEPLLLESLS